MDPTELARIRLTAALEDPEWPGKVRLLNGPDDIPFLRRLSTEAGVPLVIIHVHVAAGTWEETIRPLE